MNRDNVLWALAGLLVGFVVAYLLFETVGSGQPPRMAAGTAAAAPAAPAPTAAQPPAATGPDQATLERRATELEKFVADSPQAAGAWLQLANVRFDLERFGPAVEAYQHYLELAPADPDVLTDLGVCLHMVGRSDEALAQFDRAQQMDPGHWKSLFNEVVVLAFDLGRFDDAAKVLDQLRAVQPDNPDVQRLADEVERRRNAA